MAWFYQAQGRLNYPDNCGQSHLYLFVYALYLNTVTIACHPLSDLTRCENPLVENSFHLWRPELGSGVRFGEAKHPGPTDSEVQLIRFCVTNPTSINQKADFYIDLAKFHQCDVISLSETAATDIAQANFSRIVGKNQLKCHWSPPVPAFRNTITGKPHEKGKASGVGLCTKLPFRPCRNPFDAHWSASTRLIHTIVKIGNWHVQVVTVYCKPTSSGAAVNFNQELLNYVMSRVEAVPLPFIIMGDFNMELDRFDGWPHLEAKGCRNLPQLYHRLFGSTMPATCKEVTTPDNAIISSALVPFVKHIQVLRDTGIPTHHPVIFDFAFPSQGLFRHRLKFPRQFVELGLNEHDFAMAFEDNQHSFETPNSLEEWGICLEKLADIAVKNSPSLQTQGFYQLPASFRGRCQAKHVTKCPVQSSIKKAWDGVYEPSTEVLTMATRRKITQLRRIQSLMRRLFKIRDLTLISTQTYQELKNEWNAILKSTALGKPLLFWLYDYPEIPFPAYPLPSAEWLHDVSQLVQHVVDSDLKLDRKYYQDCLKFQRQVDKKFSSSKLAFKQVRGQSKPPVTEIKQVIQDFVKVVLTDDPHQVEIYGEFTHRLSCQFPLHLDTLITKVVAIDDDAATLDLGDETWSGEEEAHITQNIFSCDPVEIAQQLNQYWLPIWQKDSQIDDLEQSMPDLQQITRCFPAHPAITVDMHDPDIWMAAIKKQKANSARGIDAVSSQELKLLPKGFVAILAHVMSLYPRGFPDWFMTALTCPLPKHSDLPEGSGTRPITILSQLYRTWAAVATSQIVKVLSHWVPSGVTGLLPGRGASDCAYSAQFELELAAHQRNKCSGIVMDLKKCFNNIKWTCGYNLLKELGIPPCILRIWIYSLAKIYRYWVLQGDYFQAGVSTGGFPEGDSWSVVVMVALATAWVCFLTCTIPACAQPRLSAYADNWSWTLQDIIGHHTAMTNTCLFISIAGLSIDWTKTWFWATANADARQLCDMLEPFSAPVKVSRCHSANDLGYQMQYSSCPVLGNILNRFDDGIKRLGRLTGMPHGLDVKEHIVLSSIFPASFHGAETRPISGERVQKFRSRVASALFGSSHSLSPAIALLLTAPAILDPEFWLFMQAFRAARKYLCQVPLEKRDAFFHLASRCQGGISSIRGPAGTFAFYLRQLGWSVDPHGLVHLHSFLSFPFLGISLKRLIRFATLSWQDRLVTLQTQRTKLFRFPDIDRASTVEMLNKFSPAQRKLLIREIAGGYQTQGQKQKWVDGISSSCVYCGLPDSRSHRLLWCSTFQSSRDNFASLVSDLEESQSLVPEFPVCFVDPEADILMQIHFKHPKPVFASEALRFVEKQRNQNTPVHWFTDGSCFNPTSVISRYSSYSIILDIANDDSERKAWGKYCGPLGSIPPTLVKAAVARTQGEQDILRAELSAICHIMLGPAYGIIHSDSSAAIAMVKQTLESSCISQISHLEHLDLLLQIWEVREVISCSVCKIKAHLDVGSLADPLQAYRCLGNKLANDTAQQVNALYCASLVSQLDVFHQRIGQQKIQLEQVFSLLLTLTEARIRLPSTDADATQSSDNNVDRVVQSFVDWSPATTMPFSPRLDTQFVGDCILGNKVSLQTLQWLGEFLWPTDTLGPQKDGVGTSWIELAVSWMYYHQQFLPVKRPSHDGSDILIIPEGFDAAKDMGVTLSELGCGFQSHLGNLQALVPQAITPDFRRGKVASLYMLGYKQFTTGINIRPKFPMQPETIRFLKGFLQCNSLDATPSIPSSLACSEVLPDCWQKRQKRAHAAMKRCYKVRKGSLQ